MNELTIEQQQEANRLKLAKENAVVLSNIIELVTSVGLGIIGKDVADNVEGETLNRNVLSNIVGRKLKEKLLK